LNGKGKEGKMIKVESGRPTILATVTDKKRSEVERLIKHSNMSSYGISEIVNMPVDQVDAIIMEIK